MDKERTKYLGELFDFSSLNQTNNKSYFCLVYKKKKKNLGKSSSLAVNF